MSRTRDLTRIPQLVQGTSGSSFGTANGVPSSILQRKNFAINGNFDIWQRGTSFTPTTGVVTYNADRWFSFRASGAHTVSRVLGSIDQHAYGIKVQRTAGDSTTAYNLLGQVLESIDSKNLSGRTVTISFYAYAGANYSSTSNILVLGLRTGTGGDQSSTLFQSSSWTGNNSQTVNVALTSSPTFYQYTFTIPSGVTQIGWYVLSNAVGTAGADDSFTIERFQIERNSTATVFEHIPVTQTLSICQRYYETGLHRVGGYCSAASTFTSCSLPFKVTKRAGPTCGLSGFTNSNSSGASIGSSTVSAIALDLAASGAGNTSSAFTYTADAEL